jgi:hypothetical protein
MPIVTDKEVVNCRTEFMLSEMCSGMLEIGEEQVER